MVEIDKSKKRPPRNSARKRRGHKAKAEAAEAARAEAEASKPKRAVKSVRQLDPEAFKQVDLMIGSFAKRRFGPMMPKVAEAFFGVASSDERTHPELQQAFALYFVYGYRDAQGVRILDMFANYGLELEREQKRVLDACLRARFVVFALERKNTANKQLLGRDVLRGVPMTVLDNVAFAQLAPGDVLVAYMFPIGDLWRPLGMATKVARARAKALSQGLSQLARTQGFAPIELPDRRPAQVFWTAYRVADMSFTGQA
ncbi:hypothetical protein ENSA5_21480 [Enhygromyxa salina]|uniref:Uncharacterized protein n=1 Tax=Enhygromyxa salina TaxID=215803 RepID=A0A2S9YCH4_9BACT|nr:hypothetical protein [Enhygromyxa salina]PRQ02795.1 hypothetical protein ENSA5_21480 [Enhygromyxa salina]